MRSGTTGTVPLLKLQVPLRGASATGGPLPSPDALKPPFRYRLATPADDAALRRLTRAAPMPGSVAVTYEREPDFLLGNGPLGDAVETLVAEEGGSGRVVAAASRAVRRAFVGGEERRVGYLSGLRVDPAFQGRHLTASGFRALRRLHDADPVPFYLATITAGNRQARGLLAEKPRGSVPAFRPLAEVTTLVLVVRRRVRVPASPFEIEAGSAASWPETVAFLREHGRRYAFFPVLTEGDLGTPLLQGLGAEDFILARRGGELVGAVALWDQGAYKQTVVRGYGGALRWARPLVNVGARAVGAAPLPAVGEPLRSAYAAFLCTRGEEDPRLVRVLLRATLREAARRGHAFVPLGLAEGDPRLAAARRLLHIPYASTLYTAAWPDGHVPDLRGRTPHVEVATL